MNMFTLSCCTWKPDVLMDDTRKVLITCRRNLGYWIHSICWLRIHSICWLRIHSIWWWSPLCPATQHCVKDKLKGWLNFKIFISVIEMCDEIFKILVTQDLLNGWKMENVIRSRVTDTTQKFSVPIKTFTCN